MLLVALLCVFAILHDSSAQSCDCSAFEERLRDLEERIGTVNELDGGWYRISHGSQRFAYKLFKERVNYQTARLKCSEHQATLASTGMRIPAVRDKVKNELVRPGAYNTWLGLDDLGVQGEYVWSDDVGSTRSNTDWYITEPTSPAERCVHFSIWGYHDFQLNDSTCPSEYFYLCEKVYGETGSGSWF